MLSPFHDNQRFFDPADVLFPTLQVYHTKETVTGHHVNHVPTGAWVSPGNYHCYRTLPLQDEPEPLVHRTQ